MFNSNQDNCPKCGVSWDGGSILESWKKLREDGVAYIDKSDEELETSMKKCYSPPYRWGRIIGVELPYNHPKHYDGISYWQCPDCKTMWDRFTSEETLIENIY
jgi:hypothetical protein